MFEKNFVYLQTNIAIFYFKNLKTSENDYSRPIQVLTCAEGGVGSNAHRAAKNGTAGGYYVLKNNEFHMIVDNASSVPAHKAVLHVPPTVSASRRLTLTMGEATGIDDIEGGTADAGPCYDLQGRRVESPESPGLYIRNGKKVIIK
jgi:hypothetical protein